MAAVVIVSDSNECGLDEDGIGKSLSKEDCKRLVEKEWLTDKIILNYLELLKAHLQKSQLRVVILNSHFTSKYLKTGYSGVCEWYSKADYVLTIFNDHGTHWTVMVIKPKDKQMVYYDSLSVTRTPYFSHMKSYFQQCLGLPQDTWHCKIAEGIPRQTNSSDCGVFLLESHSKCTYRVTRKYKPLLKRVKYKVDMHCQHFQKKLTDKQVALARCSKRKPLSLVSNTRRKKTQCPSKLSITIQVPSKVQLKKYPAASKLAQHQAVIKLTFDHNHPLESAHVLSFRPVAPETKEKYFSLFNMGHSAASARYYYETLLLENEPDDAQQRLAYRAVNPNPQDVSRLYNAWRQTQMGDDNGEGLFEQLEHEIQMYNERWAEYGGKAKLQRFEISKDLGGISGEQLQRIQESLMKMCDSVGLIDDTKQFTYEEFKRRHALNVDSHSEKFNTIFRTMFNGLDINGDGVVSMKEWELHYKCMGLDPKYAKASFQAMDTNGGGEVSLEEFVAYHVEFLSSTGNELNSAILYGPLD